MIKNEEENIKPPRVGTRDGATLVRAERKNNNNSPPKLLNRGIDDESNSEEEDEDPSRMIVACPRPVIVASEAPKGTPFTIQNMPNYITQDDSPAENTRSKTRKQETIMRMSDEVMLSCIQMTKQATINPKAAASRKYPVQLLCELAAAVLDQDTGDLLEYKHLLKHPKLKKLGQRARKESRKVSTGPARRSRGNKHNKIYTKRRHTCRPAKRLHTF